MSVLLCFVLFFLPGALIIFIVLSIPGLYLLICFFLGQRAMFLICRYLHVHPVHRFTSLLFLLFFFSHIGVLMEHALKRNFQVHVVYKLCVVLLGHKCVVHNMFPAVTAATFQTTVSKTG